ncbi:MAG: 23S rRNA (guanosine(2251)-2'-O)-methyltransferase RlmB [Spirochaetes bacterium RBG_13_51_14]|nr:MAG: 23S rRNA (guanosine(2251)-2'-O)-methyltransferase RlmB [Spirochaetes bacterium RBG_13_51_14]
MNTNTIIGRNPVHEYLKKAQSGAGLELHVAGSAHGRIIEEIIAEAKRKGVPVRTEDRNFFSGWSSSRHQGVMLLVAAAPDHAAAPDEDELLARSAETRGVIVLLDQITDPRNAGAIIRTAEALGCDGIVIPRSHAAGITPAAVKASAGATAHIDILHIGNVASFIDRAKSRGFWVIGTSDAGDTELSKLGAVRPAIVVIGSEESGMRRLTAEKCDYIVRIPLSGKVSSLNASVAAGIVLYEVTRND